jgi:ubiquinone/menaquinone biosynthesis C-methylase UbiE
MRERRGGKAHHHEPGHGHGAHGNPPDLESYLARLEGEDRIAWQKPDEVVGALGLRPGDSACDIGVGPGYFALRLARAVGPRGRVYAIDVEPRMIEILRERLRAEGLSNVRPILARGGKPALPPRRCDVILVVNTFHHFPDGPATLRALARRLAPGGRIVNVDFHDRELPVGPPPDHKISREAFIALARQAGLEVAAEHPFLPYQYFLVLKPAPPVRGRRAPVPPPRRTRTRRA